jgi:hypothetical protein
MDATGACQPGTTNGACGSGGAACAVCSSSQSCVATVCQTNGSDGGMNTDAGGTTTDAGSSTDAGQATDAGRGSDGGSSSSDSGVDAGPSCIGCYNGAQCVEPWFDNSNSYCGVNGANCVDCSNSGNTCDVSAGTCGTFGISTLGDTCSSDTTCGVDPNTHNSNVAWCFSPANNGYCTGPCDTAGTVIGACQPGQYCLPIFGPVGASSFAGLCLAHCTNSIDCDTGKWCDMQIGDQGGYCVPTCSVTSDCSDYFPGQNTTCNVTAGGQCCGAKDFACCAAGACNTGLTCVSGTCT